MPNKMAGLKLSSTLESLHCVIFNGLKVYVGNPQGGGGGLSCVCHGGFLLGVDV